MSERPDFPPFEEALTEFQKYALPTTKPHTILVPLRVLRLYRAAFPKEAAEHTFAGLRIALAPKSQSEVSVLGQTPTGETMEWPET